MGEYWNRKVINLVSGKVYEYTAEKDINMLLFKNNDANNLIYGGPTSAVSATLADISAQAGGWGVLTSPVFFKRYYLVSAASMQVVVTEGNIANAAVLLQAMVQAASGGIASNVNVTGLPALPAGGNNIGDVGIVIPANVIAGMATLPAGVNNIGSVEIIAGTALIGSVEIIAGTALMGRVGIDQTTPGTSNLVDATGGMPTAPTVYNVVMAAANTEYVQALPAGCHKFALMMQTNDGDFRVAFSSGKVAASVAPFLGFPAGSAYNEDGIKASLTLYFASSMAGKIMQIVAW